MLSQLSADYFARSPVLAFPLVALGLFLLVFIGVSLRALLRERTELDRMAQLPLQDTHNDTHQEAKQHG
jgi:cbb3-type cytochrome oxidase subunit 3